MSMTDLWREGLLRPASLPPKNWKTLEKVTAPLTVPLIAEDYPAKTAAMWNAVYTQFGMPDHNSMMVADPKNVALILDAFRSDERYRGGGAGIGFKEVVIAHLNDLTPLARAMGSVNIIKKVNGMLIGGNTDGVGYVESLAEVLGSLPLAEAHILMLGAGGTGRAIAFALAERGAHITILNRTESKALSLADEVNAYVNAERATGGGRILIPEKLPLVDAVVSVVDDAHSPLDDYSPLGDMSVPSTKDTQARNREQTELLLTHSKPNLIVSDIRIRSTETPMLHIARMRGLRTLDGIPMVINQGVEAFWWLYQEELEQRNLTRRDIAIVMRQAAIGL